MGKDKKNNIQHDQESIENLEKSEETLVTEEASEAAESQSQENEASGTEELQKSLEAKTKQCEEYFGMLQRAAAEFDNYKKRTAREKEALYSDSLCDVVAAFLPVADSIDRALQVCMDLSDQSMKEGVELVARQLKDVLKKLGVEQIETSGEEFNPDLHNAVMHVEDDSVGQNVIVEEFQKGYRIKDRVIRHSMVKVAN